MFLKSLCELINRVCQQDTEYKKLSHSPIVSRRKSWHAGYSPVRTTRRMNFHGVRSNSRRSSEGYYSPTSSPQTSEAEMSSASEQTMRTPEREENSSEERLSVTNATKRWLSKIDDGLDDLQEDVLKISSSAKKKGKQRLKQQRSKQSSKCGVCRKPFSSVRRCAKVVHCTHTYNVKPNALMAVTPPLIFDTGTAQNSM